MIVDYKVLYDYTKYVRSYLTYFNMKFMNALCWFFLIGLVTYLLGFDGALVRLLFILGGALTMVHILISIVHIVKDYLYVVSISISVRYIGVFIFINLFLCFIF